MTISKEMKKVVVIVFLLLTAMSFGLPRETFDPHIGVDYDIFCQLTSYINTDLKELKVSLLPEKIECLIKYFDILRLLRAFILGFINFIRPPPMPLPVISC